MTETLTPFCSRCQEDFPVAVEPSRWRMGFLRRIDKAPKRIQRQFTRDKEFDEGNYLCGNCFFDLTD